jgi:hypothetical protein
MSRNWSTRAGRAGRRALFGFSSVVALAACTTKVSHTSWEPYFDQSVKPSVTYLVKASVNDGSIAIQATRAIHIPKMQRAVIESYEKYEGAGAAICAGITVGVCGVTMGMGEQSLENRTRSTTRGEVRTLGEQIKTADAAFCPVSVRYRNGTRALNVVSDPTGSFNLPIDVVAGTLGLPSNGADGDMEVTLSCLDGSAEDVFSIPAAAMRADRPRKVDLTAFADLSQFTEAQKKAAERQIKAVASEYSGSVRQAQITREEERSAEIERATRISNASNRAFLGGLAQGASMGVQAAVFNAQVEATRAAAIESGDTEAADLAGAIKSAATATTTTQNSLRTGRGMTVTAGGGGPMSLAEQKIEATRLSTMCNGNPTVSRWKQQAQAGSMRASYEAAAALIQCFYDNVDSRYPAEQKQKWLNAIQENRAQAKALQ